MKPTATPLPPFARINRAATRLLAGRVLLGMTAVVVLATLPACHAMGIEIARTSSASQQPTASMAQEYPGVIAHHPAVAVDPSASTQVLAPQEYPAWYPCRGNIDGMIAGAGRSEWLSHRGQAEQDADWEAVLDLQARLATTMRATLEALATRPTAGVPVDPYALPMAMMPPRPGLPLRHPLRSETFPFLVTPDPHLMRRAVCTTNHPESIRAFAQVGLPLENARELLREALLTRLSPMEPASESLQQQIDHQLVIELNRRDLGL